jgi:anti-sigma28 factor (negative regulator of flagellin synthesis)
LLASVKPAKPLDQQLSRKVIGLPLSPVLTVPTTLVKAEAKGAIIMEIKGPTSVETIRSVANQAQTDPVSRPSPSVSVSTADTSRMADLARAVQQKGGLLHTVRLAKIEATIRAGNYHPSASEIASRLLDAAEIDEHLQAMLKG